MRVAFAGTPAVAIPTLEALINSDHIVDLVITQPASARGRSSKLVPSEVAEFAANNNLEVITPSSINDSTTLEFLKTREIDIAVVVAFGQILKPDALKVFDKGWINAHFSLLPTWRGAAPVQAAIIHGDEITGVTTFLLDSGMDSGPVYGQVTTQILPSDTAGELLDRLSVLGADLVIKTLDAIEDGTARPIAQSDTGVSYASKLETIDGQINWNNPALAISRQVRAFIPKPGAWTMFEKNRIELGKIEICTMQDLEPGKIKLTKTEVLVGTGSVDVKLTSVKPAGKSWMDAAAWARGLRDVSLEFNSA